MPLNKKIAFYTLGCKVNQYETESIKNQLIAKEFTSVNFEEEADIYIINSCTVTSIADKKTRNMLRRAKKTNPQAIIIVTGCYAETNGKELLEISEIDYVVGNKDKQAIIKLIEDLTKNKEAELIKNNSSDEYEEYEYSTLREMTRAYVKIQDGCNEFCAYCKIPFARGRSRSRKPENILAEITRLTSEGYKEIILIGINIGAYGLDFKTPVTFEFLVNEILKIDGLERVRFGSVYPDKISDEFIKLFENKKVMPHLHISLQSCDDEVLAMMKRKYSAQIIEERFTKLKSKVSNMEFTADIIVGFPGETDEMFENTCRVIEKLELSDLHVFQYSDRELTLAEKMPNKVPSNIKQQRAETLEKLKEVIGLKRKTNYIDKNLKILVEEVKGNKVLGHSENYFKIQATNKNYQVGEIYQVKITKIGKELLISE